MQTADFNYTVAGKWPFPTDMLRRDGSHPATDEDRRKVESLSGNHLENRGRLEVVEISLTIPNATPRQRPLTSRWESFGWRVPSDEENLTRAESDRLARLEAAHRSALAKLTCEEREAMAFFAQRA